MTVHKKTNSKTKTYKKHNPNTTMQFIVWTQNGGPLPDSVAKKLDDAMQRVINDSKLPLLATTLKL